MSKNNFPMKDWHVSHMEKTILKYVKGLPANASSWERRQDRKYGRIASVCRQIDYDIKHGVEREQVLSFIEKVRKDSLQAGKGGVTTTAATTTAADNGSAAALGRLDEIKEHFFVPETRIARW
ncbi:hypothetical protein [Nitrososphaera sp.]|uniref:hypothetical protein n=1 Tax=Nitrososphaera sp. TaxID=1971748 RepID=UPI00307E4E7C